MLHKTGEARFWQKDSKVKVCTQSLDPQFSSIFPTHSPKGDPGLEDTSLCRDPGLRVGNSTNLYKKLGFLAWDSLSSWLGARMATTALYLEASEVQRKKWPELPSMNWIIRHQGTSFSFLTLGFKNQDFQLCQKVTFRTTELKSTNSNDVKEVTSSHSALLGGQGSEQPWPYTEQERPWIWPHTFRGHSLSGPSAAVLILSGQQDPEVKGACPQRT